MIEYAPEATQDVSDIYEYGAVEYGIAQADKFGQMLYDRIAVLADHPLIGADCGYRKSGLRRILCLPYIVYYRQTASGIRIIRILHGRMDPARHL